MSSKTNFRMSQSEREEMNKIGHERNALEKRQREEGKRRYGYFTQRHVHDNSNKSPMSKALEKMKK